MPPHGPLRAGRLMTRLRRPAPRPAQAAGLGRERGTPAADGAAWYRANPSTSVAAPPSGGKNRHSFFFSNFLCKNCESMFLDGGIGDSYSR